MTNYCMKCSYCQKPLQTSDERFYIGHWPRGQRNATTKNYHPECFLEFAGEEYANEVTGYTLEDDSTVDSHDLETTTHTAPDNVKWRFETWKE